MSYYLVPPSIAELAPAMLGEATLPKCAVQYRPNLLIQSWSSCHFTFIVAD